MYDILHPHPVYFQDGVGYKKCPTCIVTNTSIDHPAAFIPLSPLRVVKDTDKVADRQTDRQTGIHPAQLR